MANGPLAGIKVLEVAGIGQNLVRLSVGLESTDDLVEDVLNGLEAAQKAAEQPSLAVAR